MNSKEIGQLLRSTRRKCPAKQKDIAAHAGITPSYLGMIERGEREASLETITLLAEAMGYGFSVQLIPKGDLFRQVTLSPMDAETAESIAKMLPEDRGLVARLVDILPHIPPNIREFLEGQISLLERAQVARRRSANQ